MINIKRLLAIGGISIALVGCGAIDSGNTGVRTAWNNEVNLNETGTGFYTAVTSSVEEFVGKEIMVALENMTPRAGDNLVMAELDLEIYYTSNNTQAAELKVKYANAHVHENGYVYPAYNLIRSQGRSAVYKAVGTMDSLQIHKSRKALADEIKTSLQDILNESDPDVFTITKVIIKKANTDPTIEESIQIAIKKDKELEAAEKEEEIKKALARANTALTPSLSPEVIRMREIEAMVEACQQGTCIIDFTEGKTSVAPLLNVKR